MLALISHNKKDELPAHEVAIFLAAESVPLWFDEWEIQAGDSIVGKIEEALASCSHFVLLWSASASGLDWVRRELRAALAKAIKAGAPRIIPVRLDDTPLPELLADIRSIRYSGGSEEFRSELIRSITGKGASGNLIRSIVRKYHEIIRVDEQGSTFGLTGCPKCGSDRIESGTDWIVDGDGLSGTEFPVVRCRECSWQGDEFEIATLGKRDKDKG